MSSNGLINRVVYILAVLSMSFICNQHTFFAVHIVRYLTTISKIICLVHLFFRWQESVLRKDQRKAMQQRLM